MTWPDLRPQACWQPPLLLAQVFGTHDRPSGSSENLGHHGSLVTAGHTIRTSYGPQITGYPPHYLHREPTPVMAGNKSQFVKQATDRQGAGVGGHWHPLHWHCACDDCSMTQQFICCGGWNQHSKFTPREQSTNYDSFIFYRSRLKLFGHILTKSSREKSTTGSLLCIL